MRSLTNIGAPAMSKPSGRCCAISRNVRSKSFAVGASNKSTVSSSGAIKNAVLDVADSYRQPLNLVFGKQGHFPEEKIRRYIDLYDYGVLAGRITSFAAANPIESRPLQCVDVFAYEMARPQRAGWPERYPFQRIVDGAKVIFAFWCTGGRLGPGR